MSESQRFAASAVELRKSYGAGDSAVHALAGVTVAFPRGEFAAVMGPSGSGKSTLMQCLAGLDSVSSGQVYIDDVRITALSDRALTKLRRDRVGFVFQSFNLVPTLTARQNMLLPLSLARHRVDRAWLDQVVQTLGLADRLKHRPHELSGGQQQRVAVARALLSRPAVIFADEPTGNLDSAAGTEVLTLLRQAVSQLGQTVIMVTHDPVAASYADRVVMLADGELAGELANPTVESVLSALAQASAASPVQPATSSRP
ncbi:putative ABC transport system ATP-binding protein [Glaciihabitans tibetensis]|uniref:Putative ABC transport system ATP-binding protein n=1 Tax=Glaciihabitans tibetensis TaxID=1266600 RepID=A0A2T0VGQ1_9MICO|nr:ABC transporter ATP-binding protein [Glaciihabitans tibetensis]PRY69397.1 putative ABC transport system ATP-binding protein [Glaciihabitans tibetensis]